MCQFLQTEYTINFLEKHNSYHSDVIRSKLIRNIPFQDIHDELLLALNDSIPTVGEGMWQDCGKSLRVNEEGRVGQGSHRTDDATCDLSHKQSCVCRPKPLFVVVYPSILAFYQ